MKKRIKKKREKSELLKLITKLEPYTCIVKFYNNNYLLLQVNEMSIGDTDEVFVKYYIEGQEIFGKVRKYV